MAPVPYPKPNPKPKSQLPHDDDDDDEKMIIIKKNSITANSIKTMNEANCLSYPSSSQSGDIVSLRIGEKSFDAVGIKLVGDSSPS